MKKWFVGALVLLLTGFLLQSGLLTYSMYVLLAVMLLGRWLARSWLDTVTATRWCETDRAEVGDVVTVEVRIRNSGWLPVPWVLLEDMLPRLAIEQKPPRLKVKGKRLQVRMLPAGKEVKLKYDLQCEMRGYHQIGPLIMESGDLFGLHRRYRVDADPHYLMVYPRLVPLQGYDLASRRPIGDIRLTHRLYEDPTRIAGVRPYEVGDPLSRVHWRATARTGQLHCKVYDPSTLAGATIVLDFHQGDFPNSGEPQRSELAITAAAALANAVYLLGQQVGFVSNGRDAADRIKTEGWEHDYRTRQAARKQVAMVETSDRLQPLIVETRRGVEQFHRIWETLARLELSDGLSYGLLLLETASRLPRDATVVAVLGAASTESALALGNLRRQGFAISVVLIAVGDEAFEKAYALLLAEGILDVRHLKIEAELPELCQQQVRRAPAYKLQIEI